MKNLTLTRQGWRPWTYTITYFQEERAVVWVKLFITYEKVIDRIMKGVGIANEVINYTSPIYDKETSEVLTSLTYSTKNHITREGQIF